MRYEVAILVLLPTQLFAASGQGLRNFIIEESYEKVMEALEDPETTKEVLRKLNAEIVSFHVEELDANVEKELISEAIKFEATARFTAHIRCTYQGTRLNVHVRSTVYRGPDRARVKMELTRPVCLAQTQVTQCWVQVEVSRRGKDSTLLKASLHLRATEPTSRCRLIRRATHRVAQRIAAQCICDCLCQLEHGTRELVANYKSSPPTIIDLDRLGKAIQGAVSQH